MTVPVEVLDEEEDELSPEGVRCGRFPSNFLCSLCERVIEDGMPVFMCRDASYCSSICRRKGRFMETENLRRCSSGSISVLSSALSDTTKSSCSDSHYTGAKSLGRGMFTWILNNAVRKIASFVKGTELLRGASADFADRQFLSNGPELLGQSRCWSSADVREASNPSSNSDFVRLIEGTSH